MRRLLSAVAIAAATVLTVGPAAAEQDGAFNFRFGGFFPSGDSDFWRTNEAAFTLDHSDFNGLTGGVGYNGSINNYFEFDINADFYTSSTTSADRSFDTGPPDFFPIFHDTRLSLFPFTAGFRVLPAGRFARRGADGKRLVRHPVPYIGAGIGMVYWEYEEVGDFVASDLSIVYDRFKDSGVEFETHAQLGIEFPVSPEWNLSLEVRRSWAEAHPGGPFTVLNPGDLDLGGFSTYFGASVRF